MASAGGLSRRRVPNASVSATPDDADGPSTPNGHATNGASASHANSLHTSASTSHAGSAFEGGNKIAFDPRDLERENEDARLGGKPPRLTIMEEVLLLGLKDKQVSICICHRLDENTAASLAEPTRYTPCIASAPYPQCSIVTNVLGALDGIVPTEQSTLQGYLSFWNDNISYALRGCILVELALRRRIALVKDPNRRQLPLAERIVEVLDDRQTGETILDETLKMMKAQETERMAVNSWIDLLSGETWNVMKIGFQLKQVRERLAKGLVDKGVLRTEKRNFLLFDMATHPVADVRTKEAIVNRAVALLTSTTAALPPAALGKEGTQCRAARVVSLVCAAYAASVLDNAFGRLTYEDREAAFQRCDDILAEFSCWPFGSSGGSVKNGAAATRRREAAKIGAGSAGVSGREAVLGLVQEVKKEMSGEEDLCFELIAGVLEVLSKLDSLL
ncbi:Vacuolar protein sorting-associated protein 74 [Grifola frondosa]|uniref:Vacuolar protein sorting-associated protein 74 n=1 Tax=Grifola frondosa TaxID=5627 RepID=A0A1C7MU18_GRIFR|nr:Vacuolar protein sorting-associated protein 74 [Grifola frondosa]